MMKEYIEIIPIGTAVWVVVDGEKLTGDIKAVELVKNDIDGWFVPIYFLKTSLSQNVMPFKVMEMYADHDDLIKGRAGRFKGNQLVKYQILTEEVGELVIVNRPVKVLTSPEKGGIVCSPCVQAKISAVIVNINVQSLILRYNVKSLVSTFEMYGVYQNEIKTQF